MKILKNLNDNYKKRIKEDTGQEEVQPEATPVQALTDEPTEGTKALNDRIPYNNQENSNKTPKIQGNTIDLDYDFKSSKSIGEKEEEEQSRKERLLKYFSPEEVEYFYNFNPELSQNVLADIYERTTTKPTPPDEKLLKRQRLFAHLGDTLGMLGQAISHSKGAYIRERDNFAIDGVDAQQRKLKELYEKQRDNYERGLIQAQGNDFLRGLEERRRGRERGDSLLLQEEKNRLADRDRDYREGSLRLRMDQEQSNRDYRNKQLEQQSDKANRDRQIKLMELEEKKRANRANEQDKANRTEAYKTRANNTGKKNAEINIIASDKDNSEYAYNDNLTGKKVRKFPMTEAQLVNLSTIARQDEQFVQENSNVLNREDFLGMKQWQKDEIIATAYAQYLYDQNLSMGYYIDDDFNRIPIKDITSYYGSPKNLDRKGNIIGDISTENSRKLSPTTTTGSAPIKGLIPVENLENEEIITENDTISHQFEENDTPEDDIIEDYEENNTTTGDEFLDELFLGEMDLTDFPD